MANQFLMGLGGMGLCSTPDVCDDAGTAYSDPDTVFVQGPQGPTGAPGMHGRSGNDGKNKWTLTTSTFVVPPIGGTGTVSVQDSSIFSTNLPVFVEGGGYFIVNLIPSATSLNLFNPGSARNALPGAAGVKGKKVVPAGRPGLAGVVPADQATAYLQIRKPPGEAGGYTGNVSSDFRRSYIHGNLTEVYDTGNVVEPYVGDMLFDFADITQNGPPPAFTLQPGWHLIHVRQPGYSVGAFKVLLHAGNPITTPGVWNGTQMYRMGTTGNGDTGGTLQGSSQLKWLVGISVPTFFAIEVRTQTQPGTNPELALGVPLNFTGEEEVYATVLIRQVSRP